MKDKLRIAGRVLRALFYGTVFTIPLWFVFVIMSLPAKDHVPEFLLNYAVVTYICAIFLGYRRQEERFSVLGITFERTRLRYTSIPIICMLIAMVGTFYYIDLPNQYYLMVMPALALLGTGFYAYHAEKPMDALSL